MCTLTPLRTVTAGGCPGAAAMVTLHIWLSRRLSSASYTTKWKTSVTGWLPVSREVTYLRGAETHEDPHAKWERLRALVV